MTRNICRKRGFLNEKIVQILKFENSNEKQYLKKVIKI